MPNNHSLARGVKAGSGEEMREIEHGGEYYNSRQPKIRFIINMDGDTNGLLRIIAEGHTTTTMPVFDKKADGQIKILDYTVEQSREKYKEVFSCKYLDWETAMQAVEKSLGFSPASWFRHQESGTMSVYLTTDIKVSNSGHYESGTWRTFPLPS